MTEGYEKMVKIIDPSIANRPGHSFTLGFSKGGLYVQVMDN